MQSTKNKKNKRANRSRKSNNKSIQADESAMVQGVYNTVRTPSNFGNFRTVGFPDRYRCLLRYSMQESCAGASGAQFTQQFRGNSLFDPDLTNTGHQPTYFDQLSAVYGKYIVVGCSLEVEFVNTSTTIPLDCAITASDQILTGLTLPELRECAYSWSCLVSNINTPSKTLRTPMLKTSKVMGQNVVESDSALYCPVSANPTDIWYLQADVQSIDAASSSFGYIRCTLLYECVFKDLTSPGSS